MEWFFENTWFVLWLFAIVIILRWFHVMSTSTPAENAEDEFPDSKITAHPVR